MKNVFLVLLSIVLLHSISHATIRRVGYFGSPVAGVDYTTFQLAHDAASPNDTIMMHPGSSMGGNISKALIIIGPGYFLNPVDATFPGNAGLQANIKSTSDDGVISFQSGSSNTQIIGCSIRNLSFDDASLNNILVKRCFITFGNFSVLFNASANNVIFQQCVFNSSIFGGTGSLTNLNFLNCLFINGGIQFSNPSSGFINNCIFALSGFNLGSGAWLVTNCISPGPITGTNTVYNNNVGTSTQFPSGNGNLQNQPWENIFTLTGSTDAQYTLKAGSPAIGAGIGGTNCGIFGGASPYRLSGIPSVPTIYALTSPQGTIPAGNTVQINLSTRSNN